MNSGIMRHFTNTMTGLTNVDKKNRIAVLMMDQSLVYTQGSGYLGRLADVILHTGNGALVRIFFLLE